MKLLVATQATQGQRKSDFSWANEGELVAFGFVCGRDANNPDPDGGCGCGRSLVGLDTRKGTTTFKVEDRPLTETEFVDAYIASMKAAGWGDNDYDHDATAETCICHACFRKAMSSDAVEVLRLANTFTVGSVLELRKDTIQVRKVKA